MESEEIEYIKNYWEFKDILDNIIENWVLLSSEDLLKELVKLYYVCMELKSDSSVYTSKLTEGIYLGDFLYQTDLKLYQNLLRQVFREWDTMESDRLDILMSKLSELSSRLSVVVNNQNRYRLFQGIGSPMENKIKESKSYKLKHLLSELKLKEIVKLNKFNEGVKYTIGLRSRYGNYQTIKKEFNDERHFSNWYDFMEGKGFKIIGVEHTN